MKAILSGRAAAALIVDGDTWHRIDADRPEDLWASGPHEWSYVFGVCQDLQFLDVQSHEDVRAALTAAVDQEHALSLALICLDPETRHETRELAADDLDQIVTRTPMAIEFLRRVFSSKPLPSTASIRRARAVSSGVAREFFDRLEHDQPAIARVHDAWNALPSEILSGLDVAEIFAFAVHSGLCLKFADAVRQSHPIEIPLDSTIAEHQTAGDLRRIVASWTASIVQDAIPALPHHRQLASRPPSRRDARKPGTLPAHSGSLGTVPAYSGPLALLEFSDLLVRELPFIERLTHMISRRQGMDADEIEEFTAEVRLRLVKNDYALLRAYQGRALFSTYIAAVIRRMLINYRRHQRGKWHDSAEAQRLGRLGIDVERALVRDGRTLQETLTLLREKHPEVTIDEIERIARLLPAKVRQKFVPIEEAESLESTGDADRVVRTDMAARISAVVCAFIDSLPGDEQLIFRLRYDCDMTVAQISRSLHRDQQVLYRLFYKHLDALRAELTKVGVDARAVEDLIGSDSTLLDFRLKNRTARPSEENEIEGADRQEDTSS
ncbi:MAG: hypothetical protein DMF56_17285 [Acidobacteria bacterium]|nr:MAG: hypothetical protein DMF56_17285 [Acidobacteriota bacterium]